MSNPRSSVASSNASTTRESLALSSMANPLSSMASSNDATVIDLSDHPPSDDKPAAAAPATVDLTTNTVLSVAEQQNAAYLAAARPNKRQRRRHTRKNAPSSAVEVIDLEQQQPNDDDDDAYLQAVGPWRMDFVSQFASPHVFQQQQQLQQQVQKRGTVQRVYAELLEYKVNLPIHSNSSIFVRAHENQLNCVRAVITGPTSTPYCGGTFAFDIFLPPSYPAVPPQVEFLTTGGGKVRFNPNLYTDGTCCLSLLGTWSGPAWVPNKSTLLQVLVSIQGLVLGTPEPYYNEPGFTPNQKGAATKSAAYTKQIRRYTCQYALRDVLLDLTSDRVDEFRPALIQHYCQSAAMLETVLGEWVQKDNWLQQLVTEIKILLQQLVRKQEDKEQQKKPAATANKSNAEPIEID